MLKYILLLILIVGCSKPSAAPKYDPIDWDSKEPIVEEPIREIPLEEPKNKVLENLLLFHNEQRELKGRAPFELDPYLCEYAQKHAEWMAQKDILRHSDVSLILGRFFRSGENIAWNQKSEKEVVLAWMNSRGHRANILNRNFIKIGFGVAYNEKNEPYWCTCFGG